MIHLGSNVSLCICVCVLARDTGMSGGRLEFGPVRIMRFYFDWIFVKIKRKKKIESAVNAPRLKLLKEKRILRWQTPFIARIKQEAASLRGVR